jgi:crotonobetainyl-CoA:carnitine CoA-transferase CaiB-like acyl-CoA transferase
VLHDEHFVARGFPAVLDHDDGRQVTYSGAPLRFVGTPCGPQRRAPRLGEHDTAVHDGTVWSEKATSHD